MKRSSYAERTEVERGAGDSSAFYHLCALVRQFPLRAGFGVGLSSCPFRVNTQKPLGVITQKPFLLRVNATFICPVNSVTHKMLTIHLHCLRHFWARQPTIFSGHASGNVKKGAINGTREYHF